VTCGEVHVGVNYRGEVPQQRDSGLGGRSRGGATGWEWGTRARRPPAARAGPQRLRCLHGPVRRCRRRLPGCAAAAGPVCPARDVSRSRRRARSPA